MVSCNLKYFEPSEFRKASPSCEITQMDVSFLVKLDAAREIARVPFKINSAFRSVEYEKQKGRSGTSSHCVGVAVDIACSSAAHRVAIVSALLQVGFTRLGIGKHFVHVDCDTSKPNAIWLY